MTQQPHSEGKVRDAWLGLLELQTMGQEIWQEHGGFVVSDRAKCPDALIQRLKENRKAVLELLAHRPSGGRVAYREQDGPSGRFCWQFWTEGGNRSGREESE